MTEYVTILNEESNHVSVNNSLQLLIIGICASGIIAATISAVITAVVMRILFVMRCKRRKSKQNSSHQNSTQNSVHDVNGPFYEELKLTNKENTLDFAQNEAYVSTLVK